MQAADSRGWKAKLDLRMQLRGERTVVTQRRHQGPLVIQRPFHPEADGTCHVYLLHPPGGVVGGDELAIDVRIDPDASALCTTPAATKFYRGERSARQLQRLQVLAGARLEWVPQETIVFDGAHAELVTRLDLARGARALAWEILCLGRPAARERFARGRLRQRFELWREGQPLWVERASYRGGHPECDAPWGLGGRPVCATLVCTSSGRAGLDEDLRTVVDDAGSGVLAGVTQLDDVVVCRCQGERAEAVRACLERLRARIREKWWNVEPFTPRVWAT